MFELKSQLVQENKNDQNKNSAQHLLCKVCLIQGGIRGEVCFLPLEFCDRTRGTWTRRKRSSNFFFFLVGKDTGNVDKGIRIGKDEGKIGWKISLLC